MVSSWVGVDDWFAARAEDENDYRGADGLAAFGELVRRIDQARPEWQKDALCREYPDVSFFPEAGRSGEPAKDVCSRCSVADACLDYALTSGIEHGIWAGVQGAALRRMRKGQVVRPGPE